MMMMIVVVVVNLPEANLQIALLDDVHLLLKEVELHKLGSRSEV